MIFRIATILVSAILTMAIAHFDITLGIAFDLNLLYIIPVLLATWKVGSWGGIFFGLMAGVILVYQNENNLYDPANKKIYLWNLFAHIGIYALVAILFSRSDFRISAEKILASTDKLTGFFNKNTFERIFALEIQKASRAGQYVALALLDIDNYKNALQKYGPEHAETLFTETAGSITRSLRVSDLLGRLMADRFGICFIVRGNTEAMIVLNRIRENFNKAMAENNWKITMSMGAVVFQGTEFSNVNMYENARKLLIEAKNTGKNNTKYRIIDDSGITIR